MTKVDCLKRLCQRLFGYESKGDNICEILDDMYENCECDYSASPLVDTGKKWVDGKPIYSLAVKTTLGNLAAEINKYKPHTIISFYGQAISTYGNQMPIPSYASLASQYRMDLLQSNSTYDVMLQYGEFFKDEYGAYATIEFTVRTEKDIAESNSEN